MEKDIFQEWLNNNKDCEGLTDKSYRKFYEKQNKTKYEGNVNTELATYGDAVLKLVLCEILWGKGICNKLTEKKKEYESDKVLVSVIARHYDILKYLRYDKNDDNKPKDYNYQKKRNYSPHKYIATAIEACLGEIFIKEKDFKKIEKIVKFWIKLIDNKG